MKAKKKNTRKNLREIEKSIEKHIERLDNSNVTELVASDFEGDRLTFMGYSKIKHNCTFLDKNTNVEIRIPKENEEGFKKSLKSFVVDDILQSRKDRRQTIIAGLLCLIAGITLLCLGQIYVELGIVYEITLITTWALVGVALEKILFNLHNLRRKRYIVLKIYSAKIKTKN